MDNFSSGRIHYNEIIYILDKKKKFGFIFKIFWKIFTVSDKITAIYQ